MTLFEWLENTPTIFVKIGKTEYLVKGHMVLENRGRGMFPRDFNPETGLLEHETIAGDILKKNPHTKLRKILSKQQSHKELVEQALKEGKPVPPEVLKDYPDLAKKYGKSIKEKPAETPAPKIKPSALKRFEKTETFTLPPQEIPMSWKGETALVKLKDGITFKGKITGIGKNYVEIQPEGTTGSVRHSNATIENISVTKTSVIPPAERAKIIAKEYKEIKNDFEKFGQYYGEIPKEKFFQVLDELKDELPNYVTENLKKIADNYYSFKNGAVFEPNPEFAKGKKVIFNTNYGGKAVPGTQAEIIDIEPTDMPGKVKLKLLMPDGTEQWFIGDRETFKIPVKGHPKVNAWPIVLAVATGGLLFPALLYAGVIEDWDKEQKGRGIPWPLIVLGAGLVVWLGSKAFKRWKALKEQGLIDDATFEKFKGGSKADFKDVIKTKQGGFFKFKFRHYFWPVETFLMHIEEKTGMRMWRDLYRPVMEGMKQRIKAEVRYLDRVFKTFGKYVNNKEFRRKLGEYLLAEEKSPGSGAEVIRGYKYAAEIRNVAQKYRALFDELARDFQIEHLRERYFPHRLPQEFLRTLYEQSVTKPVSYTHLTLPTN